MFDAASAGSINPGSCLGFTVLRSHAGSLASGCGEEELRASSPSLSTPPPPKIHKTGHSPNIVFHRQAAKNGNYPLQIATYKLPCSKGGFLPLFVKGEDCGKAIYCAPKEVRGSDSDQK